MENGERLVNRNNYQLSIINYQLSIRAIIILTIIFGVFSLAGCAGFLEDSIEIVSAHEAPPYERQPVEQIVISNFNELRQYLLEMIATYEQSAIIQYQGVGNEDVEKQASIIAEDILVTDAITVYAVSDITITAAQIVTYYELVINIEYKRSQEQINSIISTSTQRYMMTRLLDIMSEYYDEAVFHTNQLLDRDEIRSQITELYYQNPRRLVMMPFITVEIYGETNNSDDDSQQNREEYIIYEIRFGYTEDTDILREMRDNLDSFVRTNAARADGDTDGEILLSLVQNLIAGAQFDEGTAGTIAMHGPQNIAATAFGALVRGSAVGEGFAMAFKALCDDLGLDCRVVLGSLGDRYKYHAWNIVNLDGYYYHIDVAMCAAIGVEAGFLKSDEDFAQEYTWDTGNAPRCDGPLTLDDLLPPEEPDVPEEQADPADAAEPSNPPDQTDPEPTMPSEPTIPTEPEETPEPSEPTMPTEPEETPEPSEPEGQTDPEDHG